MDSTDKLLQGLQNINSGDDGSSKPKGNLFSLGEAAHNSGDFDKALNYYLKAADSSDSNAMFRLGQIYLESFGYHDYNVSYNSDLGTEWMKRAGNAGSIEAMKYLADVYAFGFRDIDSDFTEAVYWFKKAVAYGDDDALDKLTDYYWSKSRDNVAFAQETFKFYQSLADKGNVRVIERLADCYAEGRGIPRDKYKAIEWYKTAANFQSTYAMYWLGNIYGFGIDENDNDRDIEEGLKWHQKAVNLGLEDSKTAIEKLRYSMIQLADSYSEKKDYSNAVKWYKKFGKFKLSHNQYGRYHFALAETYRYGLGVNKDLQEAIRYYLEAIEYDHNDAQNELQSMCNGLSNSERRELLDYVKGVRERGGFSNAEIAIDMLEEETSGGCFITTAVCESFSKPDDCFELTTLRKFRDTWLTNQPDGKSLIAEYYSIAPAIVNKINNLAESNQVYEYLWHKYLSPCLNLIKQGENMACKQLYVEMIKALKKKFLSKET